MTDVVHFLNRFEAGLFSLSLSDRKHLLCTCPSPTDIVRNTATTVIVQSTIFSPIGLGSSEPRTGTAIRAGRRVAFVKSCDIARTRRRPLSPVQFLRGDEIRVDRFPWRACFLPMEERGIGHRKDS